MRQPQYFVDFLREPLTDAETGEVVDAHPSFYEAIPGTLADIRHSFCLTILTLSLTLLLKSILKFVGSCCTCLASILAFR